jgi:Cys-tRNA(Pro)/Cys-tRNA(Cys) deacylase
MPKPPPKTNAARILDRARVSYEIRTYAFDESDLSAVTAAEKLNLPVHSVFKTLVARNDKKEILLACIPADTELDLKALGSHSGGKKSDLVPIPDLPKLTGYIRGGCSPLGTKKPYRLFIDSSCELRDAISISAGLRGVQLILDPTDLIRITDAKVATIARNKPEQSGL